MRAGRYFFLEIWSTHDCRRSPLLPCLCLGTFDVLVWNNNLPSRLSKLITMPPRARRSLPSDDECGSGQSLESIAKDQAAQAKLLARAAARKSSPTKSTGAIGKRKTVGMPKRFFTYKKPEIKTGGDGKRRKGRDMPAFPERIQRCSTCKPCCEHAM